MKDCRYCGKPLPEEMQFCPYCMHKLIEETPMAGVPAVKRRTPFWLAIGLSVFFSICLIAFLYRPWNRDVPIVSLSTSEESGFNMHTTTVETLKTQTALAVAPTGSTAGNTTTVKEKRTTVPAAEKKTTAYSSATTSLWTNKTTVAGPQPQTVAQTVTAFHAAAEQLYLTQYRLSGYTVDTDDAVSAALQHHFNTEGADMRWAWQKDLSSFTVELSNYIDFYSVEALSQLTAKALIPACDPTALREFVADDNWITVDQQTKRKTGVFSGYTFTVTETTTLHSDQWGDSYPKHACSIFAVKN